MIRRLTIAAAVPLFALAEAAEAQVADTASSAKPRAECRLAHQVLTKGQPAVKREWAVGKIGTCRELGGEAIAAELDPLPADAEARIRTLVRRLARQADDDVVRAQAWHLATRVGIDVEAPR